MSSAVTPGLATQAALRALGMIYTMINSPEGSTMADPQAAAQVYTLAAGRIEAAATDTTRVPTSQRKVYRDVIRAAAKRSFEAFAQSPHPPDPALGAALDSTLAGDIQPLGAEVSGPPGIGTAANALAGALLEVPPGGFNAAQLWLRSMAMSRRRSTT